MFQGLNVFKVAHSMATHAGQRQAIVSQNVANADTPGYSVQDIQPFARAYQQGATHGMRASRTSHLNALTEQPGNWPKVNLDSPRDPNGNSVSLELELLKGVEIKRQHDRALAIYKSSLSILRASLGRA